MTIYNLGSINLDSIYRLPHLPKPGETLAATGYSWCLGGKGANQSVAAAKAGSRVVHIGAVGADGALLLDELKSYGVACDGVVQLSQTQSGSALIFVDDDGENSIVILAGANGVVHAKNSEIEPVLQTKLAQAMPGDTLLMQNELAPRPDIAADARARGVHVIYSAAPFDGDAVQEMLGQISLLAVNEGEAEQLANALGVHPFDIDVPELIITRGAAGAQWRGPDGTRVEVRGYDVDAVDTTGAGDTFIGYFAAARDQGLGIEMALDLAARAGALKVTRFGTAKAIPIRAEVDAFRQG